MTGFSGTGALIGGLGGAGIGLLAGGGLGGALLGGAIGSIGGGLLAGGNLGGKHNGDPHPLPPYMQKDLYDTLYLIKKHPVDYKIYKNEDALPPDSLIPIDDLNIDLNRCRNMPSRFGKFISLDIGLEIANRLPGAIMPMKYLAMIDNFILTLEQNFDKDLTNEEMSLFISNLGNIPGRSFDSKDQYVVLESKMLDLISLRLIYDLQNSKTNLVTYGMLLDAMIRNPFFNVDDWL